jgi:hypothetical protein
MNILTTIFMFQAKKIKEMAEKEHELKENQVFLSF